jgi:hypothetical protein
MKTYAERCRECTITELMNVRHGLTLALKEALQDAEKSRLQLEALHEELVTRASIVTILKEPAPINSRLSLDERDKLLTADQDKLAYKPPTAEEFRDTEELMVELWNAGNSYSKIRRHLNSHDILNKTGKSWTESLVSSTMTNLKNRGVNIRKIRKKNGS